ncbi:hypothetical protein HHK36_018066 [Tetracentron sinense]|uniref:Glycosyltransferase N-terminal domain-containing protein n=1 Tax=Tetracentron sinense TaxID=13715 RepID=A0A834YY66_TETSI|nr:hypothetical protein HHK36_018066 [Tetracentron sinense]
METKQSSLKVVMLPWVAHGHISPFLELAKKLSRRNFNIYFCSTPVNLCSIKEQVNQNSFPSIQLVELHLPAIPDLPPQYHTTKGLPPHLTSTLRKAFDMAIPIFFTNILKTLNPHILIYDFILPRVAEVALAQNIPAFKFSTFGAAAISSFQHSFRNPQSLKSSSQNNDEHKKKPLDIILIRSFREIEANKKEPSSTLYVSFGSECFLSKEEIEELAHGLEHSKVNFIWVVRFPEGEKIRVEEALPPSFLHRVGERGLVVEGWAPQMKILGHSSIGGFVSHCGWSSVIEGMKYGVPIIAMPMHLDQPTNARMVVEIGIAMEVNRDKDGRLDRGEVAKVIKEVVG